ncbi:UbiA prenyltransferase family protein [Mycobacterium sp. 852002-40037_SCH5390672]|uniref:UbiA family prenyltransferase n=1 Tax=Mycobacterium sp. 852002-40037_SCH5390672 TaxID=1834089 RepID=UPI0008058420|nr:UbiA prenyltransferase family protein [Mycobacterium sp. 852002-40037_SCH5390672]OBB96772.1 hypothetical protein A5782_03280 [Mycobacterium sp. 852002-40037_SCH5390672]
MIQQASLQKYKQLSRLPIGVVMVMRPWIWGAAIPPFYLGYVIATRQIVPAGCVSFDVHRCWSENWRMLIVLSVTGSMCWLFSFLLNDIYDLPADRDNPRRQKSPLVRGWISPRAARTIAALSAMLAIVGAVACGRDFVIVAAAWLFIGWAYSAPPLRLKNRPGLDTFACAIAVGAFAPALGWAAAKPLAELPWAIPVLGVASIVAIYIPATISDYETDRANGVQTVAVRLGRDKAYWIGFGGNVVVFLVTTALDSMDSIVPRRMLPIQVTGGLIMMTLYHILLHRQHDQRAIWRGLSIVGLCAIVFLGVFGLMYAGWI